MAHDDKKETDSGQSEVKSPRKCVFVIMPFGEKEDISPNSFDVIYKRFFKPILEELNCDCERADDTSFMSASIFKKVLNPLCDPQNYVLADLTGHSPNVMYELGVRHALINSGTILITQDMKYVPFDLKGCGVILYDGKMRNEDKFKRELKDALDAQVLPSPIPEIVTKYDAIVDVASKWKEKYEDLQREYTELAQTNFGNLNDRFNVLEEKIDTLRNDLNEIRGNPPS